MGVALPTRHMDRRADAIVVGLGRILSAFLFAVFSVEIPKWLGVTYSSQRGNYYKHQVNRETTTIKELSFRVCWGILGHFFVVYCILLLYFCNPDARKIPISTAVGVVSGFGVVWAVWIGRTRFKEHTTLIAAVMSSIIMISSAAAFSAGCWYIKEVWYEEDIGYQDEYTLITFFGWLALCVLANYLLYRLTRRKLAQAVTAAVSTDGNSTTGGSLARADLDAAKSLWRYQPQVFQPPDSVCCAATELSKATAHVAVATVRSPFQRAGSALSRIRTHSCADSPRRDQSRRSRVSSEGGNSHFSFDSPISSPPSVEDGDSFMTSNRARTNTEATVVSTASATSSLNHSNRPRSWSETSRTTSYCNGEERSVTNCRLGTTTLANEEDAPSHEFENDQGPDADTNNLDNVRTSLAQTFAAEDLTEVDPDQDDTLDIRPSVDLEDAIEEVDEELSTSKNDEDPSLWYMVKTNTCCGKRRRYKAPPRKGWERVLNIIKWTLWAVTSGMHLYFVIINIGATTQQNRVRAALPGTFELLYPSDYVVGQMCAWDKASPDADIRTFDSLEEVYAANYTVIHCGACGACSNWNDLSLQWTTRTYLANLGQKCTKESLFGGTDEDVQKCNEEEIGFTEECSSCWTVDQLCAKTQCVFIYLQALIVNQVSNFNVDPDDITTATCDEALCGPEFVPCSGATRRRMNIVSDIPRPQDQQCTVANEDWSVIFNHP